MAVIVDVCFKVGHNITTHIVGQNYDPMMKVVLNRYERWCTQCGKTPAEILVYKAGGAPKKRKVKNDHDSNPASSPAGSEVAKVEPVDGSEFNLPESRVQSGTDAPHSGE